MDFGWLCLEGSTLILMYVLAFSVAATLTLTTNTHAYKSSFFAGQCHRTQSTCTRVNELSLKGQVHGSAHVH